MPPCGPVVAQLCSVVVHTAAQAGHSSETPEKYRRVETARQTREFLAGTGGRNSGPLGRLALAPRRRLGQWGADPVSVRLLDLRGR